MNYLISYSLYKEKNLVKSGTIRVKNRNTETKARKDLEVYLRKKFTFDEMKATVKREINDIFGQWKK